MQNGVLGTRDGTLECFDITTDRPRLVLAAHQHGQRKNGVEKAPAVLLSICNSSGELITTPPSLMKSMSAASVLDAALVKDRNPETTSSTFLKRSEIGNFDEKWGAAPLLNVATVASNNFRLHEEIVHFGRKNLEQFFEAEEQLRNPSCSAPDFPKLLTIGGDHSIAIGSVSAVSILVKEALSMQRDLDRSLPAPSRLPFSSPDLVVFWVDAHADINTPAYTLSGNLHGCPVSLLAGVRLDEWRALPEFRWATDQTVKDDSFIKLSKLVYIGLRDLDPDEVVTLDTHGVKAWFMPDVKRAGRDMKRIIRESLAEVDPMGVCPIHISFDVDGIDPRWTPSTGTPVPDGLFPEEGYEIISLLRATGRVVSMDLVEVNPCLGADEEDVRVTLETSVNLIEKFLV